MLLRLLNETEISFSRILIKKQQFLQSNKPNIKSQYKNISSENFDMFQVCSCNTDNIEYCSHGKCIHSLLHTFPHLHGIGRSSGKEIVMFGFITSSSSCSLQPYSSGSIIKLFANGERNQTYDCRYARFMCSKILDGVGGNLSRSNFLDFLQ